MNRERIVAGVGVVLALAVSTAAGPIMAQQQAAVRVPTSVLERYVGEYAPPDGPTFKVRLDGGTLFQETPAQRRALQPISETLFHLGGVFTVEFVIDQSGGVTMITSDGVEIESRTPRKGSRAAPPPPLPSPALRVARSVLEQYVGTYEFLPGQMSRNDLRVVVRLKGETLVRTLGTDHVLTPVSETRFRVGNTALIVEFVIDDAGVTQVMGLGFQQLLARRKPKR